MRNLRTACAHACDRRHIEPRLAAGSRRARHRARRDRAAPETRYATGGGARTILFLRKILPDRMFDRLISRMTQGAG